MYRIVMRIVWLQVVVILFACNSEPGIPRAIAPTNAAPGHISLEISSNKQNWQFVVTPTAGSLDDLNRPKSSDSSLKSQAPPTGQADCSFKGSQASSPDDRFIAQCDGGYPGKAADFRILQASTKTVTFHWGRIDRQILGFVWSPNSQCIALLTSSQTPGHGPLELLWAYAGHPVPHVTVYLELIRADGIHLNEYVVMSNVVYGEGRILEWKE